MKRLRAHTHTHTYTHTHTHTIGCAGNSVHVDRMFLVKHMPNFIAHLNYRIVDVSSVKELARRWFPYVSWTRFTVWLALTCTAGGTTKLSLILERQIKGVINFQGMERVGDFLSAKAPFRASTLTWESASVSSYKLLDRFLDFNVAFQSFPKLSRPSSGKRHWKLSIQKPKFIHWWGLQDCCKMQSSCRFSWLTYLPLCIERLAMHGGASRLTHFDSHLDRGWNQL